MTVKSSTCSHSSPAQESPLRLSPDLSCHCMRGSSVFSSSLGTLLCIETSAIVMDSRFSFLPSLTAEYEGSFPSVHIGDCGWLTGVALFREWPQPTQVLSDQCHITSLWSPLTGCPHHHHKQLLSPLSLARGAVRRGLSMRSYPESRR